MWEPDQYLGSCAAWTPLELTPSPLANPVCVEVVRIGAGT